MRLDDWFRLLNYLTLGAAGVSPKLVLAVGHSGHEPHLARGEMPGQSGGVHAGWMRRIIAARRKIRNLDPSREWKRKS